MRERTEENILTAKEHIRQMTKLEADYSEWADWYLREPSEEQTIDEEEPEDGEEDELSVDANEIYYAIYVFSRNMIGALKEFIEKEKTGSHITKRELQSCIKEIRSIRNKMKMAQDLTNATAISDILDQCETICRLYQ